MIAILFVIIFIISFSLFALIWSWNMNYNHKKKELEKELFQENNDDNDNVKNVDYSNKSNNFVIPPYTFPTLTPQTKCTNPEDAGTWTFVDENTEMTDKELETNREACQKDYKNFNPNIERSYIPDYTAKEIETVSRNVDPSFCIENMIQEFPKISKYCRVGDDMKPIDPKDLIQKFCNGGTYNDLKCVNKEDFSTKTHSIECDLKNENDENFEKNGLYFCDSGEFSCEPCSFNHLKFESDIHDGFLTRICESVSEREDVREQCKQKGVNEFKNFAYNRGLDNFFHDDNLETKIENEFK